ncbi:hypothetical protein LINGRAHAP2_LOCUS5660 [Linum grandiflorum]
MDYLVEEAERFMGEDGIAAAAERISDLWRWRRRRKWIQRRRRRRWGA